MVKMLVLAGYDLKNIRREPMLVLIGGTPLFMALAFRWLIPLLAVILDPVFALPALYPLLAGMMTLFPPMLTGMLVGFLLLDERDDNVLPVLLVTPLARNGYLLYRLLWPTLLSFLSILVVMPLTGLLDIPLARLAAVGVIASLEAPLVALLLLQLAANKVEGLVLAKGLNLPILAPLAGYYLPGKWGWLAGIIPFTWPVAAYLYAGEGGSRFWLSLAAGAVVHAVYLAGLLRAFNRKVA